MVSPGAGLSAVAIVGPTAVGKSDVAVDSSILCTLEGKCSIFDDSRVQFYELASFHGFQIYGVAVGCTLYSSGYGVTVVSTVTSCKYSGYSEQISKLFHCLFF